MAPPPADLAERRFVRVWDLPVRLVHWLLVALLGLSWWSGKQHLMEWHRLSGYGILGLLVFRIYWGFAGGRTARFAGFVRGPARRSRISARSAGTAGLRRGTIRSVGGASSPCWRPW